MEVFTGSSPTDFVLQVSWKSADRGWICAKRPGPEIRRRAPHTMPRSGSGLDPAEDGPGGATESSTSSWMGQVRLCHVVRRSVQGKTCGGKCALRAKELGRSVLPVPDMVRWLIQKTSENKMTICSIYVQWPRFND